MVVYLPQEVDPGTRTIHDKEFVDHIIEGPAIVSIGSGTRFEGDFEIGARGSDSLEGFVWTRADEPVVGCIELVNCRFVWCKFFEIGWAGGRELTGRLARAIALSRGEELNER